MLVRVYLVQEINTTTCGRNNNLGLGFTRVLGFTPGKLVTPG